LLKEGNGVSPELLHYFTGRPAAGAGTLADQLARRREMGSVLNCCIISPGDRPPKDIGAHHQLKVTVSPGLENAARQAAKEHRRN
jgi:hypothetical protein